MEGAARSVVGPAPFQSHEVSHHIRNLRCVKNPVNSLLWNHSSLVNFLIINLFGIILRESAIRLVCRRADTMDFILIDGFLHFP